MPLEDLAVQFFRTFARLEYALKTAGFNNGDGPAEANWREFALSVEHVISHPPSHELAEAIAYFFNDPPKKQFIAGGIVTWQISKPATNSRADELLVYVRRVRNNLFHGAKFNIVWFEPERAEPLLSHGIVILLSCMNASPAVRAAYGE